MQKEFRTKEEVEILLSNINKIVSTEDSVKALLSIAKSCMKGYKMQKATNMGVMETIEVAPDVARKCYVDIENIKDKLATNLNKMPSDSNFSLNLVVNTVSEID